MRPVVKYSIAQTVFINVIFVILTVAGLFSLFTIPVENMPNVDIGKVFIHTVWFGASADDVEQLVTAEIEDALDGLENVEYIRSDSYRNFSSVLVKFNDDTNYKYLYDELRFRTLNIKDQLPQGADEPDFLYIDTHEWLPVIVVNISGNLPQRSLKLMAEELKSELLAVPDVQSVNIEGEYVREFHVSINPEKLRKYGITFNQAAGAIQSANTKIPAGRFEKNLSEYMLDTGKRLSRQEEVLNIIVRKDGDGNFVRVRDLVTNARISHRDPSRIPSVNGDDTLRLRVLKETRGNAVNISETIKKIGREFEKSHEQEGIKVVFTNDSTLEINDSVKTLGGNLILGMSLVTILLWLTLGFRNAMLTAIGIPFAFLCSIIIMKLAGVSLNTISLFAFVLVTGIMVDDAVIIMENIFRHLQMGKSRKDAVIDGTSEVMLPVISSALTTILAFLPMLIMTGSTGEFFAQIPKTVTYALTASLLEALFILPIHILDWGPKGVAEKMVTEDEDPFHHLKSGIFAILWKVYHWILKHLLNHKILTLAGISFIFFICLAMLILSITGIMPLIKVKFFPGNYFRYHVTIVMPSGTTINTTDQVVRDLSRFIMSIGKNQAQSASGDTGFYEDIDYQRYSGNNFGQIVVTLPDDKDKDFPENPTNDPILHLEYIRKRLKDFVEEKYRSSPQKPVVKVFEESDGPPTGKPVNIRITAISMADAVRAADLILAYMQNEPELKDLTDIDDDRPDNQRAVKFVPRQASVFEYGLMPGDVTIMAAAALNGFQAGKFRTIDEEIDLMVRLARESDSANNSLAGLSEPADILDIPVIEHSTSPVMLRDLIDISYENEPNVRTRYKGRPSITIMADIKPGTQLSPARVQVLVNKYVKSNQDKLYGASVSFGGEFESTSRSYTSLTFAFFIALLGIYLVLSSQFNDYFQPFIIMSAVPFALIGVVMGLFFSQTTFTIGSFMAIVGLAGVAVNDSLLLLDFMNVRLRKGRSLRDAVIEACAARMRPVVITTITTMLGLMPMAVGIPQKSISWSPMATAFVAGLSSATLLALLIIPVEYEAFEKIKGFLRHKKK
ncbi:Acriflavin resistance protein [Desulfonema limicola]|uniref:Acriflavin resistance protein n=1 Tax=Desulfonema limicola TaxID=45656 RepID=A0A975GFI5_9BACT|nr:efflux RND transporter permease subunit [Desulfonema limicola]QTA79273.1 Acriflavin resistance protein [Desulfonema limicola]